MIDSIPGFQFGSPPQAIIALTKSERALLNRRANKDVTLSFLPKPVHLQPTPRYRDSRNDFAYKPLISGDVVVPKRRLYYKPEIWTRFPRPKKRLKRSPAVKMEPQDPDFVPSSPTDDYPNLTVPSLPPAVDFSFQRKRNKRRTPRKPPPKFPGRSLDKRLRMHCSHCNKDFWAKPTCREGRYVLNHKCSDHPRRQYVVGGWHRKCTLNHYAPCIDFVAHGEEQGI